MYTYSCPPHPRPFSQSEKGDSLTGVIGNHLKLCYALAPLFEERGWGEVCNLVITTQLSLGS